MLISSKWANGKIGIAFAEGWKQWWEHFENRSAEMRRKLPKLFHVIDKVRIY
jgi:hypothetical protein